MTRISKSEPRPYDNQLRTQQAEETKGRILDAAVRVMARGVATLSIPTVPREAGVSVPTIYRHFGTKQDLLAAVYPHVVQRSGLNGLDEGQKVNYEIVKDKRTGKSAADNLTPAS